MLKILKAGLYSLHLALLIYISIIYIASLEDLHRNRDRSLNTLVDNLVVDLTRYIKLVAEKAIPKSRTCEFSKLWWNKELLQKRKKMAKLGRL